MISDQDRKLAEETFDLIEASEASGNSYEANLPIGAPGATYGDGGCNGCAGACGTACTCGDCPNCQPADVSMALAGHAASAIDKILGA